MTRVHGCARGRSDGDCEIRSGRGEGRGKERSLEEENRGERTEGERKTKRREMNESRNRGGEEEITSRDGIEHVASEGPLRVNCRELQTDTASESYCPRASLENGETILSRVTLGRKLSNGEGPKFEPPGGISFTTFSL